jgi:hypothetical protein
MLLPKTILALLLLSTLSHCGNVVIGNGNNVKGNGNCIDHGDGNSLTGNDNQLRDSFRNQILGSLNGLFKTNGLQLQGNGFDYSNGVRAEPSASQGQAQSNLQTEPPISS